MASAKIAITPVLDSYNTEPPPIEFHVNSNHITLQVDGAFGERTLTFRKEEIRVLLACSDIYEHTVVENTPV